MDDVGSDHYPLNITIDASPKRHIINRPPRWKIKGVDCGMWGSKIPDSTLELNNSVKELNDDFQMRLEHATSLVLGMTCMTSTIRKENCLVERKVERSC